MHVYSVLKREYSFVNTHLNINGKNYFETLVEKKGEKMWISKGGKHTMATSCLQQDYNLKSKLIHLGIVNQLELHTTYIVSVGLHHTIQPVVYPRCFNGSRGEDN